VPESIDSITFIEKTPGEETFSTTSRFTSIVTKKTVINHFDQHSTKVIFIDDSYYDTSVCPSRGDYGSSRYRSLPGGFPFCFDYYILERGRTPKEEGKERKKDVVMENPLDVVMENGPPSVRLIT
jgi:hypothetical protein